MWSLQAGTHPRRSPARASCCPYSAAWPAFWRFCACRPRAARGGWTSCLESPAHQKQKNEYKHAARRLRVAWCVKVGQLDDATGIEPCIHARARTKGVCKRLPLADRLSLEHFHTALIVYSHHCAINLSTKSLKQLTRENIRRTHFATK